MKTVFKDRGASFCRNFDQQPFQEKNIDYSVLVAIHQKWKGLRLIAQDSCMIHWLNAVSLSSKATIIGTCSKLPAWNSVCLEQVNLWKKNWNEGYKSWISASSYFIYSGLKDRFDCIYHKLYMLSYDKLDSFLWTVKRLFIRYCIIEHFCKIV